MAQTESPVQSWIIQNERNLINCPYQPGNLIISKNACCKRYFQGQGQDKTLDPLKDDLFHYHFKRGLSICQQCPIGRKLAHSPGSN